MAETWKFVLPFFALFFFFELHAQTNPAPEQDCINAIPVCQMSYYQPNSYIGVGNIPGELPQGGCLAVNERHGAWYIFTVAQEGFLNFEITPNNLNDDYDWAVYNLTHHSCSDIRLNLSLQVSCNYSGQRGVTGTRFGATSNSQGSGGTRFNAPIPVQVGETYVLYVSNFSQTQYGYTLDFGTSTAVITDVVPPSFVGVDSPVPCGSNQITVHFGENILCGSVQPSDFTLSGGGVNYTITAVAAECVFNDERSYAQTFVLTVNPPLMQSGALTIHLVGEVTDICGNAAAAVSFPFSLSVDLPLSVTPENPSICTGNSVVLNASGASIYNWAPAVGLSQTTGAVVTAAPSQTTTYTLYGTQNGCTDNEVFTLTVHPNPTVNVSPPSSVVCIGDSVTLTASGAVNYLWNPAVGLNTNEGSTVVASPQNSTVYTVTATDANGCVATRTVLVSTLVAPFINATTQQPSICAGTSTTLNVVGGTNYQWSPATGLNTSAGATVVASPTETTTYTVTGVNPANQCPGWDTITVFVRQPPLLAFEPTEATICAGASVNLSASGATTYTWSPSTGLNTTNGPNVVASPTQSRTYTVVAAGNGCTVVGTVAVNVVSNPAVNVSPANPTVCEGESIILTASGAAEYVWSPSIGLNTSAGATVVAQPSTTTTYTVRGINGDCVGERTVTVNVASPPVIDATAPQNNVCSGNAITLNASGGTNYVWQPGGATGPNITVNPSQTTTFTVTGTNLAGNCTASDTFTVFVRENSQVVVNPPGVTLCSGAAQTLTASGAQIYSWSPATGLSQTTGPSVTASPSQTTAYTVTGISNGCTTQAVVVVVVTGATVTVNQPEAICPGQSATLSASGAATYSWQPPTGLNATTGPNVVATPSQTTTYTVTGISGGCTSQATVTVVVNPGSAVTVNQPEAICPGQSTTLSASGAATYSWQPSTGLNTTVGPNVVATPTQTTTYTVTGISGGCTSQATVTVTVLNVGGLSVTQPGGPICAGESTTLIATGAQNYSWQPPTGLNNTTTSVVVASPSQTTTYTVTGTTGNCTSTTTVTVQVGAAANVNVLPNNPTICQGESVTLTAEGATSYTWSPATGLNTTTGATVIASPTQTTQYMLTAIAGGCVTVRLITVTVVSPQSISVFPSEPTICIGGSVSLAATGGQTYTWSPALGLSSTTGSSVNANPNQTTVYTVTAVTAQGCTTSRTVTVQVVAQLNVSISPQNPSFCQGQNIVLTASGASHYSWSPAAGLSSTTGAVVTCNTPTTRTYTVTGTSGGCSSQAFVTVTVHPYPNPQIGASSTQLCEGESANLSASGTGVFSWSPATGLNTTTGPNVVANPAQTTTYTLTVEANGCTSERTIDITVRPRPNVSVTPALSTVCANGTTTLSASGAQSYVWSPATGLNTTTGPNVVASPTQTTVYTVTGTDVHGCASTASATVAITPLPVLSISPANPVRCANGDGLTLNVSGGAQYVWQPAIGLNTTTGSVVVAAPNQTTTYTVRNTTPGCETQTTVTVTVYPQPSLTVTPSSVELCSGETAVLTASGTATTYIWSPPAGLNTTSGTTVVANPTQSTVYTLTAIANACTTLREIPVLVKPDINLFAVPQATGICRGNETEVVVTGAQNYSWQPTAGVAQLGPGTYRLSPLSTTTYTLTGTSSGCSAQTTLSITVDEPVNVSVNGPNQPICPGTSVNLIASGNATTFLWQPSAGLNTVTGTDVVATPNQTTTYTVRAFSTNGYCVSEATVTVSVVPTPAIVPSIPPPSLCKGQSVAVSLSGATNYVWNPPVHQNGNYLLSPTETTVYTVSGISENGCSVSLEYPVTVNPLPEVGVAAEKTTLCVGESVHLTASGAQTYQWYRGGHIHTGSGIVVRPHTSTTYTVVGVDENACEDTAQISITVHPRPLIVAQTPEAVCAGQKTIILAIGADVYRVLPNGPPGNPAEFVPTTSGFYSLEGTDANGCKDTVAVYVRINPLPVLTIKPAHPKVCAGETTILTASGANEYVWKNDAGEVLSTNDSLKFVPERTLTITLEGMDVNGCKNVAQTTITVLGLPEKYDFPDTAVCHGESVRIYPHSHADLLLRIYTMPTGGKSLTPEPVRSWNTPPVERKTTYWLETVHESCVSAGRTPLTITPLSRPAIPDFPLQTVCRGTQINLSLPDTLSYRWVKTDGTHAFTGANLSVLANESLSYLIYADDGRCELYRPAKAIINVFPEPGLGISVFPEVVFAGEAVVFTAYADTNVIGFAWDVNGNYYFGNPFEYTFSDSGGYDLKLTIYTSEGCVYTYQRSVGVGEPNVVPGIPDAFTPNGDGINDVFELKFRNAPVHFEMWIFDRWGVQIAHSTRPNPIWDGRHPSGTPAPEGVYAYKVHFELPNGLKVAKQGTITLLR